MADEPMEGKTQTMLVPDNTMMLLIDVQIALLRVMHHKDELVQNLAKLLRGLRVLDVPILCTEQNPKGLGATIPELAPLLGEPPLEKLAFSCCGEAHFTEALEKFDRRQVIVAGIESHVCVYQTTMDLLDAGYGVQIVADAVSSRAAENKRIALERMAAAGASITSVEMVLFELLQDASGPKFKEILKIVK